MEYFKEVVHETKFNTKEGLDDFSKITMKGKRRDCEEIQSKVKPREVLKEEEKQREKPRSWQNESRLKD